MSEIAHVEPIQAPQVKRKTLEQLFNEPCTVAIHHAQMHQAFAIPGAGVESTLSPGRPGTKDLKLVFHPGYGLIGFYKNEYFLSPHANVIAAFESASKRTLR